MNPGTVEQPSFREVVGAGVAALMAAVALRYGLASSPASAETISESVPAATVAPPEGFVVVPASRCNPDGSFGLELDNTGTSTVSGEVVQETPRTDLFGFNIAADDESGNVLDSTVSGKVDITIDGLGTVDVVYDTCGHSPVSTTTEAPVTTTTKPPVTTTLPKSTTTTAPATTTTTIHNGRTTTTTTKLPVTLPVSELPLTGRDSKLPLTIALGLLITGGAAVGLVSRRRDFQPTGTFETPVVETDGATWAGALLSGSQVPEEQA